MPSPSSENSAHLSQFLHKTVSEVFDLKPTSGRSRGAATRWIGRSEDDARLVAQAHYFRQRATEVTFHQAPLVAKTGTFVTVSPYTKRLGRCLLAIAQSRNVPKVDLCRLLATGLPA